MGNGKVWLLAALVLAALWSWSVNRPVARADGVLAADEPAQVDFTSRQPAIAFKDASLQPRATFALTARVLGRENYRFDAGADLSPTDLAIGWGPMSDSAVLRRMRFSQSGRFLRWQVRDRTWPIPRAEIGSHSANMHLIPADASVARTLGRVRPGDVITLEGLLVDARKADGWRWHTSMTRTDDGDGACELVYLEALSIGPR